MEEYSRHNEFAVGDYLDILRRRKWVILHTFAVVSLAGTVITLLSKPVYRSTARILVEGKTLALASVNTSDPLSSVLQPDAGYDVGTQIEIVQGDNVVRSTSRQSGVSSHLVKLEVKPVGNTDIIDISVDSNTADYAYRFAAALPDVYHDLVTGNRKNELTRAMAFTRRRLAEERQRYSTCSRMLMASRKRSRIYSVEAARTSQLAEKGIAAAALERTGTALAIVQTKLAALRKTHAALDPTVGSETRVTNGDIALLGSRIADLRTQREALLVLYKPSHVKLREVDTQIDDLQKRLLAAPPLVAVTTRAPNGARAAVRDQILEAETQAATARTEYGQALRHVERVGQDLLDLGSVEPVQAQLENSVASAGAAIASLSKTIDDLALRAQSAHDPVTLIAPAGPALQVEPKKTANIVFTAIVGLLLGFGVVLTLEVLDDRVSSTDDVRRLVGVPTLGYVPVTAEPSLWEIIKREGTDHPSPASLLLESCRLLRTNLQFSSIDRPLVSIMITSALPSDGNTVTAVNLAIAFAMAGRRVILVDSNLRRPTVHAKLALAIHPGLTNVLLGTVRVEAALQQSGVNNLQVLSAGTLPPNPAELFGSTAMRVLHDELRARADIVIWDTPPVLAAADAQALSPTVDGVLFVLRQGGTRRAALLHAVQLLNQARANIVGVVFNRVDPRGKRDRYYHNYDQRYEPYTVSPKGSERLSRFEERNQFEALVANGAGNGRENLDEQGRDPAPGGDVGPCFDPVTSASAPAAGGAVTPRLTDRNAEPNGIGRNTPAPVGSSPPPEQTDSKN